MAKFVDILDGDNEKIIPIIVILAIVFHILVLVIVPYILMMQWKPKILSRPPTFELVQLQTPQPPARKQPAPQPVVETPPTPAEPPKVEVPTPPKPSDEKKIEPKKEETKPAEQPKQQQQQTQPAQPTKPQVEEDLSDLENLFADAPAASNVSLQISEPFEYQWYLDQLQAKIKNRWKPGANEKGEVVVQFTITRNGSLEGLKMVSSSGRAVLDRQAMQAVEMSAPFASLPAGFPGQSLGVVLTLKPQR